MLDRSDPQFASALADAIVALSRYFCGFSPDSVPPPGQALNGLPKDAPLYVAVTEGRDGPGPEERKIYSSCGDQLHAILERLGVREPFLNRRSLGQYRQGENISLLQHPHCPFASVPPSYPSYRPPAGSLCLIWTTGFDAHALVVLGPGSDPGHVLTGNYGAGGLSESLVPGTSLADSPVHYDASGLHIGGSNRALHTVIPPASIIPHITARIDLSGAPVTGDLIDALGALWSPAP